jgi:hypothetical protein
MIRIGRILDLDFFKPGILAWGLIEVTMDTDKTTHVSLISQKPQVWLDHFRVFPGFFSQIIIFCAVIYQELSYQHYSRTPSHFIRLFLLAQVYLIAEPTGLV